MYRLLFLYVFTLSFFKGQWVTLSKVEKISDVKDKALYTINSQEMQAEYLGEIHVEGVFYDEAQLFAKVYKKAKSIGANAMDLKKKENIDGSSIPMEISDYRINLYAVKNKPRHDNYVYIFSSSKKRQKLKIDGKRYELLPRTYIRKKINANSENTIASGGFLGTKIKLSPKAHQPVQYFMVEPLGLRADRGGKGTLNLKSGDIIGLEESYANFLLLLYTPIANL